MLLLFTWIKPYSLGLLSSESVVGFAGYGDDALGYGPHITPGMLTHTTKPLSNPCRPHGKELACTKQAAVKVTKAVPWPASVILSALPVQ